MLNGRTRFKSYVPSLGVVASEAYSEDPSDEKNRYLE